ncbi:sugar phosphate isomerase/epimerase family protein [Terriglobus sp. RCC_193]|uniref:sugar phosphate isomerase/epimerase family protein n=1 Tax=Terriglobus sp. RCC_193 TaxID=3239218 RepID=UPI003523D036
MASSFTRRHVIGSALASVAGLSLQRTFGQGIARALDPASSSTRTFYGAQTNAFAIQPARFETFVDALTQIRSLGYDGFETGFINLRGQSKDLPSARKQIETTGLTFLGIHIFLPEYDSLTNVPPKAFYETVAHQGAETGAQRLIFSGAPAATADELKRKAEALNTAGEFASTLGLKLAYHNHWWEAKYGALELETLYAETDPAKVSFLMDIGHASRTNLDLPAFVQKHAARLTGLHFRDFVDGKQVALGQGKFPLRQVANALKQANWHGWVINEEEREDGTKLGRAVLETSLQSLKGAFSA